VITDVPGTLQHFRSTLAWMMVMVDDLFALSPVLGRPSARAQRGGPVRVWGARARELSVVALSELVCDVTSEAEATARTARVRLEVNAPEHDNLAAARRPQPRSRNLLSNAIRHTEP
jgi:hypothetical protein